MTFVSLCALVIFSYFSYLSLKKLMVHAPEVSLLQFHLISSTRIASISVENPLFPMFSFFSHTHIYILTVYAHASFVLNELRSKGLNYVYTTYKVDSIHCDTQHFSAVECEKRKREAQRKKHRNYAHLPTCTHAYAFS